jgi:nucleoside-diphosphate-sugar epimerase
MKKKVILITGATGYVGCHLAYTFLKEGHHVIALVRETDKDSSVSERAFEAISAVNGKAQVPIENLIPIVGDVANKHEVSAEAIRAQVSTGIDEIWHCAATFSIQESERQKIEAINIKGTQHMLDLALQVNAETPPRFFYVSTAYSSGTDQRIVYEKIPSNAQNFRSLYEWSKHQAEKVIERYHEQYGLGALILRPSIVVGSLTTTVVSYSGYYQVLRAIHRLCNNFFEEEEGNEGNRNLDLRIVADPNIRPNIVPIDFVIKAMDLIAKKQISATDELKVFNIVNEAPPTLGLIHEMICESLNISGWHLVDQNAFDETSMSPLEKVLARKIAFQMPYINEDILFSNEKFREVVSTEELPNPVIDENYLRIINRIFLEHLEPKTFYEMESKQVK